MTTTPQTEAQRLAASISETLDSQDDSFLTCSVTKCLLQQAAAELRRLDALRLELQTQLADYKDACTKAETRAVPASTGMHWTENEPVRLPASRAGRVYLAGPMTGLPELNFPAFTKEAERLRDEGLQVLNPADHGIVDGADWADYLRHDIAGLASCERIHLLRGWSKSKGANLEATIAKAMGMTVTYQVDAEMEHNNAPAVPQGEPVAAWLKAKIEKHALLAADCPGSSSVVLKSALLRFLDRLPPVAATPTPAPAQEVGLTGPAVAWRMRDTGFRRPKYVYFDTKEQAVAHAAHLLQSRDDGHLTELTPLCEASTSTDLLDALRDNSWKLEPFEIPTGQGDADIGWRVVGFYMGKPKERTEATVYTDDPAAAIIAALRAKGGSHDA